MTEPMETTDTDLRASRRALLKKTVVAGAMVWTAPLVVSSPAFAASSKCGGSSPCTSWYGNSIVTGNSGINWTVSDGLGVGQCTTIDPLSTSDACGTQKDVTVATGANAVTVATVTNGVSLTITFPPGAIPIAFQTHIPCNQQNAGQTCPRFDYTKSTNTWAFNAGGSVGGNLAPITLSQSGQVLTVTKGGGCGGYSGINVYFCI